MVARLKAANPDALYCCDPATGDRDGGSYVRAGIAAFFRERALAHAALVTPNHFELEQLAERRVETVADALVAADRLRRIGAKIVLVTSFESGDAGPHTSEMLVVAEGGAWRVATPLLPIAVNGAGDAVAPLCLGHYLLTRDPEKARAPTAA